MSENTIRDGMVTTTEVAQMLKRTTVTARKMMKDGLFGPVDKIYLTGYFGRPSLAVCRDEVEKYISQATSNVSESGEKLYSIEEIIDLDDGKTSANNVTQWFARHGITPEKYRKKTKIDGRGLALYRDRDVEEFLCREHRDSPNTIKAVKNETEKTQTIAPAANSMNDLTTYIETQIVSHVKNTSQYIDGMKELRSEFDKREKELISRIAMDMANNTIIDLLKI